MTNNDPLVNALNAATPNDIVFAQESFSSHSMLTGRRFGFRPTVVLGIPIPEPSRVVYVRGEDGSGHFWYVLDWSDTQTGGSPRETLVAGEFEARTLVLALLRSAYKPIPKE